MEEEILELIGKKDYAAVRGKIEGLNNADVAELIEKLPKMEALTLFRLLKKDMAADVFAFLPTETQQKIIVSLSDSDANQLIENLYADDAADLFEEMPSNVVKRLLANASQDTIDTVHRLLQYPKESAGSLMTVEYVSLKEKWTIGQAIETIRADEDKEDKHMDVCYVLNDTRELVGVLPLKDLILKNPDEVLQDVMERNPIVLHTLDDQEEAAKQFQKYNFAILPVVDSEEHMVGIITVDDILDVMEQEATEDMHKMAAVLPSEHSYMKSSVAEQVKKRIPWLLLLMLSATFTSSIISSFEDKLATCIVLTAFIPMLMDSGGNAGGQSSATIIRALSLGEIQFRDTFRVLFKECRIAICCGLILAVVNFGKMMLFRQAETVVCLAVSITLVVTIFCAKIVGCLLPIGAKRIGIDPAVMANPIITTIVDAVSLLIYFGVATAMLGL